MVKFIFDLDGTITAKETLPIISRYFKVEEEIELLTKETIEGNIPFVESFIRRTFILGKLPIDEVCKLLETVPLLPKVLDFITKNSDKCSIATGNLSDWVEKLVAKIGCECHSSEGIIESNNLKKLTKIIKKEDVVLKYKEKGYFVVFIGDGNNDLEAMRIADVSIASGIVHNPANSTLSVADYVVYSEEALCRQLNQLL